MPHFASQQNAIRIIKLGNKSIAHFLQWVCVIGSKYLSYQLQIRTKWFGKRKTKGTSNADLVF